MGQTDKKHWESLQPGVVLGDAHCLNWLAGVSINTYMLSVLEIPDGYRLEHLATVRLVTPYAHEALTGLLRGLTADAAFSVGNKWIYVLNLDDSGQLKIGWQWDGRYLYFADFLIDK